MKSRSMMINRMKSSCATIILAIASASCALAANNPTSKGFFMGFSVGYGVLGTKLVNTTVGNHNQGFIYSVSGGYRVSKHVAFEGGYTRLPNIEAAHHTVSKNNAISYAGLRGIVQLPRRFEVYVRGGAARVSTTFLKGITDKTDHEILSNNNAIVSYYGAGIGYQVSKHTELTLDYTETPECHLVPRTTALLFGANFQF